MTKNPFIPITGLSGLLIIGLALVSFPVSAAWEDAIFNPAAESGILPDAGFAARGICGKITDAPAGTGYTMKAGKTYHAWLEYQNTGTRTWDSTNVRLVQKNPEAKLFNPKGGRVTGTVPPGSRYRFYFRMTAPATKGTYIPWFGLRKIGGSGFGENGYFTVTVV